MIVHSSLRAALKRIAYVCREDQKTADGPWRYDRREVSEYFPEYSPHRGPGSLRTIAEEIRAYLAGLVRAGEAVTYADICGRARADSFGATKHYSFSKQTVPSMFMGNGVLVCGDFFIARDFYRFVRLIENAGDRVAFATFIPVAGLINHRVALPVSDDTLSRVIAERFRKNFLRFDRVMRPGGYIFLGHPFDEFEQTAFTALVNGIATQQSYEMRTISTMLDDYWLLRKHGR